MVRARAAASFLLLHLQEEQARGLTLPSARIKKQPVVLLRRDKNERSSTDDPPPTTSQGSLVQKRRVKDECGSVGIGCGDNEKRSRHDRAGHGDDHDHDHDEQSITSVPRPASKRCVGAPKLNDTVVNDVKGVFLVISDWGFTPGFSLPTKGPNKDGTCQRNVAKVAAQWLKENQYEHLLRFVLSAGDNFYRGLDNTTDPKTGVARTFQHHWEQVYSNSLTCVPWYPVLGNHDFGDWNSEPEARNCYATTTDPERPGTIDGTNCAELNGELNEVKTTRACVHGRKGPKGEVPDCWAMPALSYAVTAWEKSLGLTIVATDGNYLWRDNYPFSAWEKHTPRAQRVKDLTPRRDESVKVLTEQVERGEELPKHLIIVGHYPWRHKRMDEAHAVAGTGRDGGTETLYGNVAAKVPAGKNVYYIGGHVHFTDDPEDMINGTEYKAGEVRAYQVGAGGGFCDSDCKEGEAAVIFGLVKTDGSITWKRVPGRGPGHVAEDGSVKYDRGEAWEKYDHDHKNKFIQMPGCKWSS